ncbi:MAG: ABC transporter permease [Acidimicrobiia bacterium]
MTTAAPLRRRWDWFNGLLRTYAVLLYIFLFTPILVVVIYSFNKGRFLVNWDGFGTNWYGVAVENEGIQNALATSLRVAAANAVVAVVLGTMAGIALARRSGKWSRPFLILVFLILVAPEIVDAISYLIFFVRINLGWSFARLVIGHSIFNSAVVTLIVLARLQGLDESPEEAAADLGATPWRAFRQITLPLMLPAVLAGALLAFTFSLDDVIISSFVSTSGGTTLPVYVFSALRTGMRGDLAAISTVTLAATLVALGVMVFALRRSGESVEGVVGTITGAG